jgi:hypothetical protein
MQKENIFLLLFKDTIMLSLSQKIKMQVQQLSFGMSSKTSVIFVTHHFFLVQDYTGELRMTSVTGYNRE